VRDGLPTGYFNPDSINCATNQLPHRGANYKSARNASANNSSNKEDGVANNTSTNIPCTHSKTNHTYSKYSPDTETNNQSSDSQSYAYPDK
jgi:hypothetical protein